MAYSSEANLITDTLICVGGNQELGAERGGSRVQDTNALDFQRGVESSARVLSV